MSAFALVGRSGAGAGSRYPARAGCLTVGRAAGNDVVLRDPGVSRRHLRIRATRGACIVEDLGSSNGTFVDDRRLDEALVLQGGESIRAGECVLLFEADPTAPAPVPVRVVPRRRRVAIGVAASLLLVAAAAALLATRAGARGGGPRELDQVSPAEIFGTGPGVTTAAESEVRFTFPGRADAVFTLRYRAADVAWDGLVEIRVNGSGVGHVTAAGAELEDRELDLPASAIREGANELVFVVPRNARPPYQAWRVGALRLVREPLPACGSGCVEEARELQRVGASYLDAVALEPANAQRAFAALARARLLLAAEPQPTPVHEENRRLLARARDEVDRLCARLRFTATRYFALAEREQAAAAARKILEAFPSDDSACHRSAVHMLDVLGVAP